MTPGKGFTNAARTPMGGVNENTRSLEEELKEGRGAAPLCPLNSASQLSSTFRVLAVRIFT